MSAENVLRFGENFDRMTYAECLAFIRRSRRQMDRFESLSQSSGEADTNEFAAIRHDLDALEARVLAHIGS